MRPITLTAHNPGPMTGAGNNTYLLFSGGSAVLVDAGIGHPQHLASLQAALSDHRAVLRAVLVTHDHADHASGALAVSQAFPRARFAKYARREDLHRYGLEWHAIRDGDEVGFGDAALTVLHTPGHSPDHVALWHEPSRTVFGGDLVIPGASVAIDPSRGGDVAEYLRSLQRVIELEPRELFPAHGPRVDDPRALLTAHVQHRCMRERQILDALAAGHRTVETIAESIYDGLEPVLLRAARQTVRAHLEKLKHEGIASDDDGWRIV